MDTKYLKHVLLRVLSVLLFVAFVYYSLYQITGGFSHKIATIIADYNTKEVAVSADAYIMRNEAPVYSNYGGTINYYVSDGEKLGVDSVIADVYSSGSGGDVRSRIIEIDRKIKTLKASNIGDNVAVAGTSVVDDGITAQLLSIREKLSQNQLDYATQTKDELLALLNRRELITTSKSNFNDEIDRLEKERSSLAATLTGMSEKVSTPVSGYFYGLADGYESIFSSDKIDTLTVTGFDAMTQSDPDPAVYSQNGKYGIGKMAYSHYWYIACKVDKKTLGSYTEGRDYSVAFPYNADLTLKMKLHKIVTEDGQSDAVLVFSCTTLPQNFSFLRRQRVEISKSDTLTGYKIPASAIRILDGVSGVYIQYGNRVYFRIAEIVGEFEGYCYIKTDTEGRTLFAGDDIQGNEIYCSGLKQNDNVVVEGIELYHGKLIR